MGQPMTQSGPCSVAVVLGHCRAFSTKLRACSYLEAVSLLDEKSLSVLCLSSLVRSSRGIWSTANRLFGVSMSTCKTRSQAHGLQTRPYTFLSLAGKHQYSVRTNNRVSHQKYPLTVDTSVCIVTVVSGGASTEALFDGLNFGAI